MDLNDILESLGGGGAVARKLNCGISAISNWKTRGIPKGRWTDLVILAQHEGVNVTLTDVQSAHALIAERKHSAAPATARAA